MEKSVLRKGLQADDKSWLVVLLVSSRVQWRSPLALLNFKLWFGDETLKLYRLVLLLYMC